MADKDKSKRYDRQLRLWGAQGQRALEAAHVALLNATATGAETLKNLVLPGIGKFTVIDGRTVHTEDLGRNFFVVPADLGHRRSKAVCRHLVELNPLVSGHHIDEDPVKMIERDVSGFAKYTLLVAADLPEEPLRKLAEFARTQQIPLVHVRSYGMIGYLRIDAGVHTVVEAHPDNTPDDLRIAVPFPALRELADSYRMDKLSGHLYAHVPYPVLLIKYSDVWKSKHGGKAPGSRDATAFKALLRTGMKATPTEENFEEAIRFAYKAWQTPSIPSHVQTLLDAPEAKELTGQTDPFWFMVAALRSFVEKERALPISGTVPDLVSDTESYQKLQAVYFQRASADLATIRSACAAHLTKAGLKPDAVSEDHLRLFCKNASQIRAVRYRDFVAQYAQPDKAQVASELKDADSNLVWYVLLRAADAFFAKHKRYPGLEASAVAADTSMFMESLAQVTTSLGLAQDAVPKAKVDEFVRPGGCEMHNIAAFVGGVASQEITKVLTHQWLPLNNTYIFNGYAATSNAYTL